jgi:hypothetical protein
MAPVTNPTVAVWKVRFENFREACQNQKVLQKNSERALEELSRMRKLADEIISQAWNEVENSFAGLPMKFVVPGLQSMGLFMFIEKMNFGTFCF